MSDEPAKRRSSNNQLRRRHPRSCAEPLRQREFVDPEDLSNASRSDEENREDNSYEIELRLLKQWAIQHHIPHHQLRQLFAILRVRLLPNLSKSVKEFLGIRRPQIVDEPPAKKQKIEEDESTNAVLQVILKKLSSIEEIIQKNRESLQGIEDSLQNREDFVTAEFSIPKNHEIDLPISSTENLKMFEQKLAEDSKCLSDTLQVMKRLKASKLSISATSILRKFITRNVAIQYTATKKMADKFVMETDVPKFLGCILEALMVCHEGTSEKEAKAAVGTALTQSKGWDGQRIRREDHNSTPAPTTSSGGASVSTNDLDVSENIEPKQEIMDVESIILNSFEGNYMDSSEDEYEN